ncbi:energy transducer TonB [Brevundimonas sp.]|jgi:protein TonB|uniref:energy transducer TonB n=1 Tax=Brevundimonas sp. TaxID=1871086 RepID=UPI0037C119A7
MSSDLVSPFAKAATGVVVAVVQLGLIAALAVEAVPPRTLDDGGAPVIELTLAPRVAFDSVNGSADSADARPAQPVASKAEAADETPRVRPTPIAPRIQTMPAQTVPVLVLNTPSRAPTPTEGPRGEAEGQGEATATGARDSRRGLTEGGAARTTGASGGARIDDYYAHVLRWVEEHKRHPGGVTGVVTVAFTLDRRGRITKEQVLTGSGHAGLDAAALRQLRASEPFPRPPSDATWRTREFRVRLDYRPREGGRNAR